MGTLIRRTLSVAVGSIALLFAVLLLVTRIWPEYFKGRATDYHILMHQYKQIASKHEARNAVIGDSRGNCILDPSRFGETWINLSLPGSFPLEGYITYDRFLRSGNRVDTLVVVYGLEFLMSRSNTFFENLTIPFRFIDEAQLEELEALERRMGSLYLRRGSLSPVELTYHQLARRLKYEQFPLSYRSYFMTGFRDLFLHAHKIEKKREYVASTLPATKGHMLFGFDSAYHGRMMHEDPDRTFSVSPMNRHYLTRLLDLAAEKGTHVVLVVPPVNQTTYERYRDSRLLRTALEELTNIGAGYANVRIEAETLSLENDCFADASGHLNHKGVEQYTGILRNKLLQAGSFDPGLMP
jgi:hypothetical protein